MNGESASFVDTNVLVYSFDRGEPERQAIALELLDGLMERGELCLSTQVLAELYVTLTRKLARPMKAERAVEVIAELTNWPVCSIDATVVLDAARLSHSAVISLRDAQMVVAAARLGAARLYTEDLNDGQVLAGVEIVNPFRESTDRP